MYFNEIKQLISDESGSLSHESNSHATWRAAGAVVGLGGGLMTGTVGAFLTFTSWFTWNGTLQHFEHSLGSVLLVVTIPMLILGAHCLDLIERRKHEL